MDWLCGNLWSNLKSGAKLRGPMSQVVKLDQRGKDKKITWTKTMLCKQYTAEDRMQVLLSPTSSWFKVW